MNAQVQRTGLQPVADAEPAPAGSMRPRPTADAPRPLGLPVLAGTDTATAALERAGLNDLTRALGLPRDPALIRLRTGGFHLANSAGRIEAGQAILDSGRFSPATPQGRALLAHELAHLAQTRLRSDDKCPLLAEIEARHIARAAAEGRAIAPVQEALAADARLFDQSLSQLVKTRFAYELARIRKILNRWIVTDGAVREILEMAEGQPWPIARALFDMLDRDLQETLLDNVSPRHFGSFRREILAAFSTADASLIAQQDEDLFKGMDFSGLAPEEILAIGEIFDKGFPVRALRRLRDDRRQGRHVKALLDTGLRQRAAGLYDADEAADQARTALARREALRADALADESGRSTLLRLRELIREGDDASLVAALDLLGGLLDRPELFQGVAEALLAAGDKPQSELDTLLDDLPETDLTGRADHAPGAPGPGHRRIETVLRLAELRPPWKNVRLAESLLSSAWIFNVLTSSEAFYAFQVVKALPDAVRERFLSEDDGNYAGRIYDNLSQSMRESAGLNFYRGGEGRLDLASIQAQLLDDALWTPAQIGRLQGLIRMAGAAGQQEWVFTRSREVHDTNPAAYDDADFRARIVSPFMLYDSRTPDGAPRYNWQPAYGAWAVENVWHMLGDSLAGIGRGLALVANSRNSGGLIAGALFGKSLGGEGISAVALQNLMGGSFMGIRFVSPEDRLTDPDLARRIEKAASDERGVNFVDRALWDTNRGVIEVMANDLAIAAIRYPIGDLLVSTGSGRMRNLDLNLSVPTREDASRPTNLDLRIGQLDLADMMLVSRGSILTINRVALRGLEVDLGRNAIANRLPEAGRGVDPFSLNPLTPILRMIGITLTDELSDRGAEITGALTRPSAGTPLVVTIRDLVLEGVQTSGGTYIDRLEMDRARIGMAGTTDDYFEILWQSVRANISQKVALTRQARELPPGPARAALDQRIARIAARIAALQKLRRDILAAQATERELGRAGRGLDPGQQKRLAEARKVLAPIRQGGITFDAGRGRIAGMQGRIVLKDDVELTELHGRGSNAPGLMAFLSDSEAPGRILAGEAHQPATLRGGARDDSRLTIELGTISDMPVVIHSGIPTIRDATRAQARAKKALDRRDWDPALIAAHAAATERLRQTTRYHQLAATGVSYLSHAEARELARLRTSLTADEALRIHSLNATDATLGFDAATGSVTFGAREFEAFGPEGVAGPEGAAIRAGGRSIGAGRGRDVELSIGIEGGFARFDDLASRLSRLGIRAASLSLSGLADRDSAISVEAAEGTALNLDYDLRAGVLEAQAGLLSARGIRGRITRDWLKGQIETLQAKPEARRTAADTARLAELLDAADMLESFRLTLKDLDERLAETTDPAARTALQDRKDIAVALFLEWERRVGARTAELADLDVSVSGLGDLTAEDASLDQALRDAITITGRGKSDARSDAMFSRAEITDARFGSVEAGRIALGQTAGSVTVARDRIGFDNLGIAELVMENMAITGRSNPPEADGGGMAVWQIASHGTTTASGIEITGSLSFTPSAEDPDQYRLSGVEFRRLRIARLQGDDLGFATTHNPPRHGMPDPGGHYGSQSYSLSGGALLGINGDGMNVALPADPAAPMQLRGRLSAGAENAVVTAHIQDTLKYGSARLNGKALSIEFLESGGQIIDIGRRIEDERGGVRYQDGLSLDQGRLELPQGETGLSAGPISGRIVNDGQITRLEGIAIPAVRLSGLGFRAGDRSVVAAAPVDLGKIRLDATLDRSQQGNTRVMLDRLFIGTISGQDLTVKAPPYEIRIRQDPALVLRERMHGRDAPPPLQIVDLDIRHLHWSPRGGVVPARGQPEATIDIESAHAAFDLLRADIGTDLDAVIDAQGLNFDFLRDGTQRLQIDDLDAGLKGQAMDGVQIDIQADNVATGAISIDGRTISFPALSLPLITLEQLVVDSPKLKIDLPKYGGRATLTGATASAILELAEPPSKAPFERLTILALDIPTIKAHGLKITVPDAIGAAGGPQRDLIISVPDDDEIGLTGCRLEPAPGQPGFTVTPDPSGRAGPQIDGRLHVDKAKSDKLGLEIEDALTAHSKVTAKNFDLDFLSSGGVAFTLQELILTQLAAEAGAEVGGKRPHHFSLMTGDSDQVPSPNAVIRDIGYSAGKAFTIGSAALAGLVYNRPDWGVKVDIAAAELPVRAGHEALHYADDGTLTIPRLTVTDAMFDVADIMAIGTGGGPSVLKNLNFLDALHGSIGLTISHPSLPSWLGEGLTIRLDHGQFDLDQIENQISVDNFVDFDRDGNRLILHLDYGNVHPITGMIPQANSEIIAFSPLDAGEIAEAEARKLRLSTAVNRFEKGGSSGDPPVSFRDIRADLTLDPTTLELTGIGGIELRADPVPDGSNITVRGGLHPRGSGLTSALRIGARRLDARVDPARPLNFGGTKLSQGGLTIRNLTDTVLEFDGNVTPKRLHGRIGSAEIRQLKIEK